MTEQGNRLGGSRAAPETIGARLVTDQDQTIGGECVRDLEYDPYASERGVLLADRIKCYVNSHDMIRPFEESGLEAAGYQMRIGGSFYRGLDKHLLKEGDDLVIRPYEVVVIETAECVRIPRFMIARWNIKVKLAYRGLLWVGAAQVDPGYVGHLACPIYNLSSKPVRLKRGEKLALIDFVKTTAYRSTSEPFAFVSMPKRGIDKVVLPGGGLESALSEYRERVEKAEKQVEDLKSQSTIFVTTVIGLLGILFAVLVGGDVAKGAFPEWGSLVRTVAVVFSLGLSMAAALGLTLGKQGSLGRAIVLFGLLLALLLVLAHCT